MEMIVSRGVAEKMNRRTFLKRVAGLIPAVAVQTNFAGALRAEPGEANVQVTLDPARTLAIIPPDFMGLGYEISSVARPGLLSARNSVYVQLVRSLGTRGVIRVGGNTSDYSSYAANAQPLSLPEGKSGSVVNDAALNELGSFLDATGWKLIWGLNLGNGSLENAVAEAKAVAAAAKRNVIAFEIGNEPDLFPRHEGHRPKGYGYDDYLREYRTWRDALRKEIPNIAFAGPDAADATEWVARFAGDEAKDITLLTHHYYREGQNPTSTIEKLLHPDPKLAPILAKLKSVSETTGVPYRICETNSFSGGGKPGVSDTLAAALWVLDFMFTLASAGCAGVNIETGVNQHGFISSYSPIADDEQGHYWAAPEYYGMLAFAQCGTGRIIGSTVDAGNRNITAHANQPSDDRTVITLINKEPSTHAIVTITAPGSRVLRSGSLVRLAGKSLDSKSGVTLGGASVSPAGLWKPVRVEEIKLQRGLIRLPAASAAILQLRA
jgi:hypothetical protein